MKSSLSQRQLGVYLFQAVNNHTELLGDVLLLMEKVGCEMRFLIISVSYLNHFFFNHSRTGKS